MTSPSFAKRHVGADSGAIDHMLAALDYPAQSPADLMRAAVPESIVMPRPLDLPPALDEAGVLATLKDYAAKNSVRHNLIGRGYYETHTPAVISRSVLENPAWYTAYTPYQPEISQGRLEAMLNFQQMVCDLTGLDIANASLLDEATAVAEATVLMRRAKRGKTPAPVLLDVNLLPQVRSVVAARAEALGIELKDIDFTADSWRSDIPEDLTGAVIAYPGADGAICDPREAIAAVKAAGGRVTIDCDLLALTLVKSPGELGADVAVGSSQRFGIPLFFGGPHAAFMAVTKGLERQLPGRLVGVSHDSQGAVAYRLALQTREQHIRRDRATSNICTAQALLAVMAGFYAVWHGPRGLADIAATIHQKAAALAGILRENGIEIVHHHYFDTLRIHVPSRARAIAAAAEAAGVNLYREGEDYLQISIGETTGREHLEAVLSAFNISAHDAEAFAVAGLPPAAAAAAAAENTCPAAGAQLPAIPAALVRTSGYLSHPVFSSFSSETEIMRYMRRLADKDLALDRTMIPLGSCTMKLNAAVELAAITWPEFASIHPYAPAEQTGGWRALIADLSSRLEEITGYDAVSVQPNAGSMGELAGLLAIRGYHLSRGDTQRTICLIPESAHGTNAASAVMAGMKVAVVKNAADGSIDSADLDAKIAQHGDNLAAIMITYPSTYGRFDDDVKEVCAKVHEAGGQVYIDGANLNALVGWARPGKFGGDVSHLNLHKTFAIPHGGGGPGVGPVCAREHLRPFLPGSAIGGDQEFTGVPVSAARFGSAGVLPISWAYIAAMGPQGLADATAVAVLAANYIAARLRDHYPVLYKGKNDLVAHECILDLRQITAATHVTAEDVAKRLIDYGFHAPTLAFPVAGTLMVEPTESEDLNELDRFIDAMIAIRKEIAQIENGDFPVEDSPLRRAPHTAAQVSADHWDRPYPRSQAAYPLGDPNMRFDQPDKYFAPVSRIDGAYGDRNLMCSCPPITDFTDDDAAAPAADTASH